MQILVLWNIAEFIINNEVKVATIVMLEDFSSLYNLSMLYTQYVIFFLFSLKFIHLVMYLGCWVIFSWMLDTLFENV